LDTLAVANALNSANRGDVNDPAAGADPLPEGEQPGSDNPLDVDGDGSVTVEDAQRIIDELKEFGPRPVPTDGAADHPTGVNRDGVVSSADVLEVVNWLNDQTEGEGEPIAQLPSDALANAPEPECISLSNPEDLESSLMDIADDVASVWRDQP
jgi:hypothetical protein